MQDQEKAAIEKIAAKLKNITADGISDDDLNELQDLSMALLDSEDPVAIKFLNTIALATLKTDIRELERRLTKLEVVVTSLIRGRRD